MTDAAEVDAGQAVELVITGNFAAPLGLVWAAWSEPQRLASWFFPDGCSLTEPHFDVRPGGAYRCTFIGDDESEYRLRGRFLEITPMKRLVFTHGWADEDGVVEQDTRVTVTFEALDGGTRLTLRQVGLVSEASRAGHEEGWSGALEHLAVMLAEGEAAG